MVKLRIKFAAIVLSIFEFHLDELLAESLSVRVNAIDEYIAQLVDLICL